MTLMMVVKDEVKVQPPELGKPVNLHSGAHLGNWKSLLQNSFSKAREKLVTTPTPPEWAVNIFRIHHQTTVLLQAYSERSRTAKVQIQPGG